MRLSRSLNLLLIIGSVLFGAVIIEVFLRINDASSTGNEPVDIVLNGHSYQLIELPARLDSISRGVVVLGDSFVVGAKCGREENLTGHLSRFLERDDIINLGASGTGIFSYAQRLQDYISDFGAPEVVAVILYANDISYEPMMCPSISSMISQLRLGDMESEELRRFCASYQSLDLDQLISRRREATGGRLNLLLARLYVYRLVREVIAQLVLKIGISDSVGRAAYPVSWSNPEGLQFLVAKYGLRKMVELARSVEAATFVAFYPNVEDLSENSSVRSAYNAAVPRLHEELGVPVYSGYDAFIDNPRATRKMVWSLTDAHPSCAAHGIMGSWIADHVLGQSVD